MKFIYPLAVALLAFASCTSFNTTQNESADRNVAQFAPEKKYIIIQNLATEKTRVYEKCDYVKQPNCAHRLVYETEMVVGGDDMRSDVGVYFINWIKFYETDNGTYPSWYNPSYPPTPEAGSGFKKWFKKSAMPTKEGEMRGAFGWYAATVVPEGKGQWIHGTIGWGSDGDRFIKVAHGKGIVGALGNLFSDLRSHGCTRHENRAVAYLQSLVPNNSTLIKIYAKEGFSDPSLARYENQKTPINFNWILTNEDVKKRNPRTSEASAVQARIASGQVGADFKILEQGSYQASQYPTMTSINGKGAKSGKSGDSYKIGEENFIGTFLVDEGRVVNYRHPSVRFSNGKLEVERNGLEDFLSDDNPVPEYMVKK